MASEMTLFGQAAITEAIKSLGSTIITDLIFSSDKQIKLDEACIGGPRCEK